MTGRTLDFLEEVGAAATSTAGLPPLVEFLQEDRGMLLSS